MSFINFYLYLILLYNAKKNVRLTPSYNLLKRFIHWLESFLEFQLYLQIKLNNVVWTGMDVSTWIKIINGKFYLLLFCIQCFWNKTVFKPFLTLVFPACQEPSVCVVRTLQLAIANVITQGTVTAATCIHLFNKTNVLFNFYFQIDLF